MHPQVIIIGAGAAGLAAARTLSNAGCQVLILEARNRIGGRIHTIHDAKSKFPIELGAEFVHGEPKITWQRIREAKLAAYDLPFEHKQFRRGRLVGLPQINEELQSVMGGLVHLSSEDKSFGDYLRAHRSPRMTADAKRFAINFVQGFDAADPERISAKSLAEEQEGIGDVEEETQFRLLGGYVSLVDYLRDSVNKKLVTLRTRTVISEIRWQRSNAEIRTPSGQIFRAPRVIITLPIGVLQIPPERPGSVRFSPDIPHWRKTATQLASGPVVKSIIRFREAFWEKDDSLKNAAFMHDPQSPFSAWWTMRPLRVPVLTAWAGGPKAVALAGLSRREMLRIAIEALANMMQMPRRRLTGMVEQFHFHDWGSDVFSRGAYSYITVGGMNARQKLIRPIESTLYFAGEALDTSGQASTVAGALASGEHAAKQMIKSL